MPAIKLTAFTGERPRITPRLLPAAGAQEAINCRLEDGSLTPIRRAIKAADTAADAVTIYKHQGDWLSWAAVVNAAPGPVDDTRLYYTGDAAPKMRKDADIYDLALAGPTGTLTATLGGTGSGDVVTRVYVYTWVTDFGEESEPSAASASIDWQPGNSVVLSGFDATPTGRNITKQRIYRSQTGQSGTYLYLIDERTATNSDYTDTVAVDAFQEALPSADWNPPPADLAGLVAMPNGMMAAFSGRRLFFCEPFRPHAWPEKYALTCDSDIVGLASIDNALIIMTEAHPYIAVGSTPGAMQMDKIESNWPCINARGIVDLGYAAFYPTHEGLVMVEGSGACSLVTAPLFSREDWSRLSPETMLGGQLSGRYVAFFDTVTADGEFVAGSVAIVTGENASLTRTNTRARAVCFDVSEAALYYVPHDLDEIWRFDAPAGGLASQYWRSKQFVLGYPENFGAIQVDADTTVSAADIEAADTYRQSVIDANAALIAAGSIGGDLNACLVNALALNADVLAAIPPASGAVTVGVIADGARIADITVTNRPARLPGGFKARTWEIDVAGDLSLTSIVMGRTMDDITATP